MMELPPTILAIVTEAPPSRSVMELSDPVRASYTKRDAVRQLRETLASQPPVDTMKALSVTERESVAKRTREDYQKRLDQFKRQARIKTIDMAPEILDAKLVHNFDQLFLAGAAYAEGEKLWAAVRFFTPSYANHGHLHLPRSSRALKGWRRLAPTATRRPLPWEAAAAVAWNLLQASLGMAMAWLMMIDTYMRPGELMDLTRAQIMAPTDRRAMSRAAVVLHPDQRGIASKTGEMNESLIVTRPWLSDALMKFLALGKHRDKIWNFTMAQFRAAFVRAAVDVGLQKWKPVLYMARHTGASLDRLLDQLSLEEVQKRGRWRAPASVRRYEKRALVQEVYNSLTAQQQRAAIRKTNDLQAALLRRIRAGG